MANNLIELEVAKALHKKDDGSTEEKAVTLSELQNVKLLSFYVAKSLIMEASRDVTLDSSDQKSAKFNFMLGGTKKKKTKLGTGDFDKFSISKPVSFDWEEPYVYGEGLPAYAVNNFPATVAQKLEKFLEQDSKDFERKGFKLLEAAAKANKTFKPIEVDIDETYGYELYEKIVKACDEITRLVDKTKGIDLIDPEKIIIYARPDVLSKISVYAMKGDHATTSLTVGQFALGSLGGFKAIACPYLQETLVTITTTNSMANARRIIAASAGKIDNLSNDLGAYLETCDISGIVLDNIPTAIIHKAKAA